MQEVMKLYEQHRTAQDFDSSMVTDFGQAKDRICFRMVNAGKNRELLDNIPYMNGSTLLWYIAQKVI